MNAGIKSKWLAALRSGKYRQGKNYLKHKDEDGCANYCCLGVLCDVAAQEKVATEVLSDVYNSATNFKSANDESCKVLPDDVKKWAGLNSSQGGIVQYEGRRYSLTELNDQVGVNFDQIADLIEKNL